jgi:hypothetical protein
MLLLRPLAVKLAPKLPKFAPAVPVTVRRKVPGPNGTEQLVIMQKDIDMGGPAFMTSNTVVAPSVILKSKGPMLDSEPPLITRGEPVVVKVKVLSKKPGPTVSKTLTGDAPDGTAVIANKALATAAEQIRRFIAQLSYLWANL